MSKELETTEMLPVTNVDMDALAARRKVMKNFVKSQMVDEVDHGIIPGTKNPSLYKPGAEKLAQLFGFGVRYVDKQKEIDLHQNFAMFSYTAEVYHLRTGTVIAQCEGSANSHEKKWKTRTVQGAKENTPIGDVMNTMMKMAQKRAFVGAIIIATGASDFYTQDLDEPSDIEAAGIQPEKKVAKATIGVKSAKSTDESQAPVCCDKLMMVSKFHQNTWYCLKCKGTQAMS